ncbi:hypothetical protein [Streptomyces sp. NPDC088736]|uniref:hypothetical protein n=1 Tax=Streptomyces sp. NPDC088736 TaxID=3365881 RepID=UPI003819F77A
MTRRQAAGWAVLSLLPATLIALAAAAGELLELAVGAGIAAFLTAATFLGLHLLDDKGKP